MGMYPKSQDHVGASSGCQERSHPDGLRVATQWGPQAPAESLRQINAGISEKAVHPLSVVFRGGPSRHG